MYVAVTGASGLVGSHLVPALEAGGHRVLKLVRREPTGPDEAWWDPREGRTGPDALKGVDALVHLAAEHIFGRWEDPDFLQRMYDSRVVTTGRLARHLAELDDGPRILVCAASIGFYGLGRGDEILTEESPSGTGLLARIGRDREAATAPASEAGLRVAHVRIGVGQSPRSGMLSELLPRFQRGLGGRIGLGRRWLSWIVPDDIAGALRHVVEHPTLAGPVNAVAPEPVTNAVYTRTLGAVVGRPAPLFVPPFVLRRIFGVFANETLLRSTRVLPTRLVETGYRFAHPELKSALRHVIDRP